MKNAIIISLKKDNSEIRDLALSIDYDIVKEFVQERNHPDVKYYIGSGKLEGIEEFKWQSILKEWEKI
jgi:50S ribosomal subunit-associated GTPase HflX